MPCLCLLGLGCFLPQQFCFSSPKTLLQIFCLHLKEKVMSGNHGVEESSFLGNCLYRYLSVHWILATNPMVILTANNTTICLLNVLWSLNPQKWLLINTAYFLWPTINPFKQTSSIFSIIDSISKELHNFPSLKNPCTLNGVWRKLKNLQNWWQVGIQLVGQWHSAWKCWWAFVSRWLGSPCLNKGWSGWWQWLGLHSSQCSTIWLGQGTYF